MNYFKKINYLMVLTLFAFGLFMFTAGGVYISLTPSGNFFLKSWQAARAVYHLIRPKVHLYGSPRVSKRGVTSYDPDQALNGFTLYTSMKELKVFLIDMNGKIVHEWDLSVVKKNFSQLSILDNTSKTFIDAYLYPNGDLICVVHVEGRTPYGGGIVKADRDGNVIWVYKEQMAHHNLSIDENNNIYILTHEFVRDYPYSLDDHITILNSDGKQIKSFSLLQTLKASNFTEVYKQLKIKDSTVGMDWWYRSINKPIKAWPDPFHTNTIQYVTSDMAKATGFLKQGEVLICLRNMNLLLAIDIDREVISWVKGGPWHRPHDPEVLPNGNIMIYDNLSLGNQTRVIEFNAKTDQIVWEYKGTESKPFYSYQWGRQQPLKNGNVLIVEPLGGRFFEVTRRGEIVWEYSNPERSEHKGKEVTWFIPFAYRYESEELTFLNNK